MDVDYGILYLAMTSHKLTMRCHVLKILVKMLLLVLLIFFYFLRPWIGEWEKCLTPSKTPICTTTQE